ncbi:signal transduction histidine kinase regulating citrate/malate metabolism [Desulfofarcimen acetoxidans DSM 771]|uniref:Signal transduction histidine kinase regulating citrate/malate metabolism n=1 Tax=Desulfofarcimen acetoxidans (strain ATCC 49208 / DSM 771 / KCTC 5769 / VKM B-1644 / 5575) TaxID=485916 RepID=C8W4Q4_DESAS|nr:ATP-binding protein [Desulfofarcimen acetoxidans]ACV63940.1 signal transduction histidine kinase regulating citrate/malate metabolism [Desulfofarcimen acetoxidans DSM 771]
MLDHMSILQLLLVSLPEAVLLAALGFTLINFQPHLRQLLLIGIFQTFASYIVRASKLSFGLHTILLLLVFILIIHLVTHLKVFVSSLVGLLGFTTIALIEALYVPQLLKITGYTIAEILNHPIMRIYFFIPETGLLLMIILLCRHFNINIMSYLERKKTQVSVALMKKNNFGNNNFNKEYFLPITLILLSICLLAMLSNTFVFFRSVLLKDSFINIFSTFIVLGITVLICLLVIILKNIAGMIDIQHKAKKTKKTLSLIEELVYTIRKKRHDFNHHLQAVYGLLETGFQLEARDYIRKIFSHISTHEELIKTDTPEVSAMLYTKIGLAKKNNINLEIIIENSLKDLPLSFEETNSILGNLIDNAMEATNIINVEKRNITIELTRNSEGFCFEVTNQGKLIKPEIINEIFKPQFSTKEGRPGLGLSIVEEIVKQYNGTITAFSNNKNTTLSIFIPKR